LRERPSQSRLRPPSSFPEEHQGSMARVTVEDCLEREDNRFALVVLASQRTRALMKGATPLVASKNKAAVTALREIATGRVHYDRPTNEAVQEHIEEVNRREFG
jgi:DNA-directed RNA polymerase subunit omega